MALTDAQRNEAVRAIQMLEPYGVGLVGAAESFRERAKLLSRTVPFSVLREEYLAAKRADNKSAHYLSDIKIRLGILGQVFDDRPVATIESRELDDWLRGLEMSPTSRVNFRKIMHTAFAFAVMRGYIPENPVTKTTRVKALISPPGILTPTEIAALLSNADSQIVPALALAAFGGLRDAEVGRMTWDRIDLTGGYIKIDAAIAKTASRRLVPVSDNLRAWIFPHMRKSGIIRPVRRTYYNIVTRARKAAVDKLNGEGETARNLREWPHNALRHSYVSYRLALIANAAQVAEECGHSIQVMKQHYRELVTRDEAIKWFAVMP
jgi:integrase